MMETEKFHSFNDLMRRVQVIEDREAISRLLMQYGRGLDALDWSLFESILLEDVELHMIGAIGDDEVAGGASVHLVGRDQFVKTARHLMSRLVATQHVSAHHEIDVDGDAASSLSYMTAFHVVPGLAGVAPAGGLYRHSFKRTGQGWKVASVSISAIWAHENLPPVQALFGLPRVRGSEAAE